MRYLHLRHFKEILKWVDTNKLSLMNFCIMGQLYFEPLVFRHYSICLYMRHLALRHMEFPDYHILRQIKSKSKFVF